MHQTCQNHCDTCPPLSLCSWNICCNWIYILLVSTVVKHTHREWLTWVNLIGCFPMTHTSPANQSVGNTNKNMYNPLVVIQKCRGTNNVPLLFPVNPPVPTPPESKHHSMCISLA